MCKLPSLPCSLLDVSDDSDSSCCNCQCNVPTHTINPAKHSPFCIPCGRGGFQKKHLSHFLSTCTKFHHARTVAHNQVCRKINWGRSGWHQDAAVQAFSSGVVATPLIYGTVCMHAYSADSSDSAAEATGIYSFTPPAPVASWLAAHARPWYDRRTATWITHMWRASATTTTVRYLQLVSFSFRHSSFCRQYAVVQIIATTSFFVLESLLKG